MELKIKGELVKRLDEHDCTFLFSEKSPVSFLLSCVEDFKAYILMRAKEIEEAQKAQKALEDSVKVEEIKTE